MTFKKSPIDTFFHSLYGFYPSKAGKSYELLVSAAMKLLNERNGVFFDQRIRGQFSRRSYQVDGIIDDKSIEAKDYTLRGKKVGSPDVEKQEGGLIELPFIKGIFASATDYTRDAKRYAEGTIENPHAKEIELYHIRPSTLQDEKGRVKVVILDFCLVLLDFSKALFNPSFTKDGLNNLMKIFPNGKRAIKIDTLYNCDGSIFISIYDWTKTLNSNLLKTSEEKISGKVDFLGKYINVNDNLIGITGVSYEIPIQKIVERMEIKRDGNACLYVKNEDGTVDTLLTDVQMKNIYFDESEREIKLGYGICSNG